MAFPGITSPNAVSVRQSIEINKDGDQQRILTVETDLSLNHEHPDYDKTAIDHLAGEIQELMAKDLYDRGDIKERR